MDIIFLPIDLIALLAILLTVVVLAIFIMKKWMITYGIIFANFLVFVLTLIFPLSIIGSSQFYLQYPGLGFRPIYLQVQYLPNIYTLFTSMFIHSGFLHIIGNMLVFFFMGIAFEERIGWKKFLLIYVISGVCGALVHSVLNMNYPDSLIPLVGASGAIFGILGAFAFAYPRDEVVIPIPIGIMFITRMKVIYAAIIFAAMETLIVWFGVADDTAHFAHFGGLISGVILAAILIKPKLRKTPRGLETAYYDPSAEQQLKKINFPNLHGLAQTTEQKEMLHKVENETVPQVRDIWLEHFIEKTPCPKCGKTLNHFERKIWCEQCGFTTTY